MEFAKFCLETRLKLGLSQETLARKLDFSLATVNRWENGKAVPQKLTLMGINQNNHKRYVRQAQLLR